MFFLAIVLLGLLSFVRLPIDLLPDISYPQLVIHTGYPDVAPAEVERFVTEPVEQATSRVPGVERVESVSRAGVSLVTLRFAWGTDMDFAALNVREKLDAVQGGLPELATRPAVLRTDPESEPILVLSVSGRDDLHALKELAEEVFKRRLEQIDGVALAAVTGGEEREIHVEVDPRLLESYGLTASDVSRALDAANASAPGGSVRQGSYRYALRTLGEFQTVDEIGGVPVERQDGRGSATADSVPPLRGVVTLRDVARVDDGFRERESLARFNGRPAVGLLLFKEGGANTVRVSERVGRVLEQLRAEYPRVEVRVATSQAGFISDAISNVVQALLLGGLLAFLVLFLFLRDARYPVAIALAIPISVVGTFALLDAAGVSLNIMSLGGLALGVGLLVDNSIVVLENVFRHREMGEPPDAAAAVGAEEVQGAIIASTLTTISVFGPILYVRGVAGQLFGALSIAVGVSLLLSLVVALTLLPMLAARWGSEATGAPPGLTRRLWRVSGARLGRAAGRATRPLLDAFDRGFARFAAAYHRRLEWALDHRARVTGLCAILLVAAAATALLLPRGLLPDVDQGEFRIRLDLPPGTPLEATAEAAERIERTVRSDPATAAIFTRVGRQAAAEGVADRETGLNTATLDIRLRPDARTDDALRRLRPRLAAFPPGAATVEKGRATALGRLLGGGEADLAVRVAGEDPETALAYAEQVAARLASVPTLANVRLGTELGQPEVRLTIDRERAAVYGLEPREIAEAIEAYMRGDRATEFVDFDRKVDVVVRLPEADRRSLATLETLRVRGVPLRELVRQTSGVGPAEIRREEQRRVLPVYADVASGGFDRALRDARAALDETPAPAGVRAEIGGENEEMRRSFRELAFAFGMALLLVYMILAAQFESFVHPFTILLSVPLALVGAVAALAVSGAGLNTMSLIGIVILVGIVVNDAIVKVDFINQMRARGMEVRDAILEAGRARLRPIVMTTVTTMFGLLPMALGVGRGADLRAPLAVAVIGGLAVATLLTLIVIPVAYSLVEEGRVRFGTGRAPAPVDAGAVAIPGD